ncbi:MAG: TrkH family potassium uptake protein, partial [Desulfobacterales bacterium]
GNAKALFKSPAALYYASALAVGSVLVALNTHGTVYDSWRESLRYAVFQVVSLGTSTGFANADSGLWPPFSQLVLMFFTLQCACSGSTSGGIKVDRAVILWKTINREIKLIKHPKAVVHVKLGEKTLEEANITACLLFICIYLGIVFLSTLLLSALGVDLLSAFSGSAAAMGNVGPGFGLVSSLSNFALIPVAGKWLLTFVMLFGRLEIYGLLLFLILRSWR